MSQLRIFSPGMSAKSNKTLLYRQGAGCWVGRPEQKPVNTDDKLVGAAAEAFLRLAATRGLEQPSPGFESCSSAQTVNSRSYGSASAINSPGVSLHPVATTMYCLPFSM